MYTKTIKNRWPNFTLAEQMANIGSEVNRLNSWIKKGKPELAENCAKRAIELIDASLRDPRWKGKEKEFLSLKEAVEILAKFKEESNAESINRYFLPFNDLAAIRS